MNFHRYLKNIKLSQRVCDCGLHHGTLLQQLDAQLINGRPIRIMRDANDPKDYYRVIVGDLNRFGDHPYAPAVSELEVEAIILEESLSSGWSQTQTREKYQEWLDDRRY